MDYEATLNLPTTSFPMRADSPRSESERLRQWESNTIYRCIRQVPACRPPWILHDGPPYAKGYIHLDHVLKNTQKDIVVKSKTMADFNAVYLPGLDCHGLPIEHQVDKELGEKAEDPSSLEKRRGCQEYALKFVAMQRYELKRLGGLANGKPPPLRSNQFHPLHLAHQI